MTHISEPWKERLAWLAAIVACFVLMDRMDRRDATETKEQVLILQNMVATIKGMAKDDAENDESLKKDIRDLTAVVSGLTNRLAEN